MNFQSIFSPAWATGQFLSSQKLGIGALLRGRPEEADIYLVYLGRSVFWDTIPKAKKSHSVYEQEEVNEHDSFHSDDSFRRHTRSMDHAKRPTPSPSPFPECPVKKPKCKHKKKPGIKIIKERKIGILCRRKSTNRKCTLCKESFKSVS